MTPIPTPDIPTIPESQQLAIRRAGEMSTAKAIQLAGTVTITDSSSYADADVVLFQLRSARQAAEGLVEDNIGSIIRPIRKGLDALYAVQRKLVADLLAPIEAAEKAVKLKMAEWQKKERERVAEESKQKQILQAQLDREAREKEQQAANAKSAAERMRLESEAVERRRLAANVRAVSVIAPVKVAGSSARFSKRAEVTDMTATIKAVAAGKIPEIVLMVNQEVLDEYYKQDAGLTSTWPGVEIKEDTTIAGKRGKA